MCNLIRTIIPIITHCSVTPGGKSLSVETCHQDHILHWRFRDTDYHSYITRDGEIYQGRSPRKVGTHCYDYNTHSIGIYYKGELDMAGRPEDTHTLA